MRIIWNPYIISVWRILKVFWKLLYCSVFSNIGCYDYILRVQIRAHSMSIIVKINFRKKYDFLPKLPMKCNLQKGKHSFQVPHQSSSEYRITTHILKNSKFPSRVSSLLQQQGSLAAVFFYFPRGPVEILISLSVLCILARFIQHPKFLSRTYQKTGDCSVL
jgi:hypothetical protein